MPGVPLRRAHTPIYIEPMPGEALASWLCRLASKIGLPPLAFIRHAFGIDCRSDAQWWRRSSREQLATVAAGTGVSLERLAAMTLADWSVARLDEHPQRLSAQYALHPPARHAADRFTAACLRCLAEDRAPVCSARLDDRVAGGFPVTRAGWCTDAQPVGRSCGSETCAAGMQSSLTAAAVVVPRGASLVLQQPARQRLSCKADCWT